MDLCSIKLSIRVYTCRGDLQEEPPKGPPRGLWDPATGTRSVTR